MLTGGRIGPNARVLERDSDDAPYRVSDAETSHSAEVPLLLIDKTPSKFYYIEKAESATAKLASVPAKLKPAQTPPDFGD